MVASSEDWLPPAADCRLLLLLHQWRSVRAWASQEGPSTLRNPQCSLTSLLECFKSRLKRGGSQAAAAYHLCLSHGRAKLALAL